MIGRYSVPLTKSRMPRKVHRIRLRAHRPTRTITLPLKDKRTDFPLAA